MYSENKSFYYTFKRLGLGPVGIFEEIIRVRNATTRNIVTLFVLYCSVRILYVIMLPVAPRKFVIYIPYVFDVLFGRINYMYNKPKIIPIVFAACVSLDEWLFVISLSKYTVLTPLWIVNVLCHNRNIQ